jgi:hypothetical protein
MRADFIASCTNDRDPRRCATRAEKAGVGIRDGMPRGLEIRPSRWVIPVGAVSLATTFFCSLFIISRSLWSITFAGTRSSCTLLHSSSRSRLTPTCPFVPASEDPPDWALLSTRALSWLVIRACALSVICFDVGDRVVGFHLSRLGSSFWGSPKLRFSVTFLSLSVRACSFAALGSVPFGSISSHFHVHD